MNCYMHREGPYHDCNYVNARDALIPAAERLATIEVGDPGEDLDKRVTWGAAFLRHMDGLWARTQIRYIDGIAVVHVAEVN